MKLGFNGSTTGPDSGLIEDIKVASGAGFDLLELRTYKIDNYLNDGGTLEELKSKFEEYNIEPYAINALEFFTLKSSEQEKKDMIEEATKWFEIAAAINCPYLVAVPSMALNGESEAHIIKDATESLLTLSEVAEKYDVKLAFEFIGHKDFSVRTLELANTIVEKVNKKNVGLVVDTFHVYWGEMSLETIKNVDKDKVFIFHVNDAEEGIAIEELTDDYRIFPGLGVIPLKQIGEEFNAIGYDTMVSLELFNEDYYKMDPKELGEKSFEYVQKSAKMMFN